MPVAFGWSVGDILGGIKLLLEAGGFLHGAYSASEEFAAFSTEVSCVTAALNACTQTNRRRLSQQLQTSIEFCVDQSRTQVNIIRDEVDNYEASLGAGQAVALAKSAFASSKWSLLTSQKVSDARHNLSMCIGALNALLQMATWEGVNNLTTSLTNVDARIEREFDSSRLMMEAMSAEMKAFRIEQQNTMQALSTSIAGLALHAPASHSNTRKRSLDMSALPPIVLQGSQTSSLTDASTRVYHDNSLLAPPYMSQHKTNAFTSAVGKWFSGATQADMDLLSGFHLTLRRPHQTLSPQLQNIRNVLDKVFGTVAASESRGIGATPPKRKPDTLTFITQMPIRGGRAESQVVLNEDLQLSLLKIILDGVFQLVLAFFLTVGCSRWMHPKKSKMSLRIQDNIQFYDYMSLEPITVQYEIVLNPDCFKALLLQLAKNTPGEVYIQRHQFRIFDRNRHQVDLDSAEWERRINRGDRLYQSIELMAKPALKNRCPRSECGGRIVANACSRCGLSIYLNGILPYLRERSQSLLSGPSHVSPQSFIDLDSIQPDTRFDDKVAWLLFRRVTLVRDESAIEFQDALKFVKQVKQKYGGGTTYLAFLELLNQYAAGNTVLDTSGRISALFADAPDLLVGFQQFIPGAASYPGDWHGGKTMYS